MSDASEYPITHFGPGSGDNYDWSRPELRASLKLGMVLESHDCGYWSVNGITENGIISGGRHMSWKEMRGLGLIIYSEGTAEVEGTEGKKKAGGVDKT